MIGVSADNRPQLGAREEVVLTLAQVQGDLGTATRLFHHLDGELTAAIRLPAHALLRGLTGTPGQHRNLVGDDERRIEAHAELSDQVGILLLVSGQLGKKLARPRLRNRTEVGDDLIAGHAHPIVGHGQRAGGRVVVDVDRKLGIVFEQRAVVQRLEAQLVTGV
ncbi:MAG TPA: hypothetical protein VJV97_03830 [Gemmatimonadaceae bacterium]|nr:hypothetical protein [Gemmatimonadaceae bacterium]